MEGDVRVRMAKYMEVSEAKQETLCRDADRIAELGRHAQQTNQASDYLIYLAAAVDFHEKKFCFLLDHVGFMTSLFNMALAKIAVLQAKVDGRDGGDLDESYGN